MRISLEVMKADGRRTVHPPVVTLVGRSYPATDRALVVLFRLADFSHLSFPRQNTPRRPRRRLAVESPPFRRTSSRGCRGRSLRCKKASQQINGATERAFTEFSRTQQTSLVVASNDNRKVGTDTSVCCPVSNDTLRVVKGPRLEGCRLPAAFLHGRLIVVVFSDQANK